jgi:PKD domain
MSYIGGSNAVSSPTTVVFSTQTVISGTVPEICNILGNGGTIAGIPVSASLVASPPPGSFTATAILGTAPMIGVPVAFAVTVKDPSRVQTVQWDFNGDGTVDQTTATLTTQFTYATAGSFTTKVTVIDGDGGQFSGMRVVSVQSPAQAIGTAIGLVEQLPLNGGQKDSLRSKLNDVAGYLARGDTMDACGALGAEIKKLNALLSTANAAPLLDEVQAIKHSLGCL